MRKRLTFENADGQELAALLEAPDHGTHTFALFAHCFTCSKDIAAASRIARALVARGVGVLRFDFTGLGNSEGDFVNTNFSSNVEDLVSAADFLREHYAAPELLVGHSLGGAAVLAAARRVPESSAVVTIGAPATPQHVKALLQDEIETIREKGRAVVELGGRRFEIQKQFLDDLEEHGMQENLLRLGRALLIFHSPQDRIVNIDEARKIYMAARHPKSFVSLDTADHLLTNKRDSEYVAATLTAWASRYVGTKDEDVLKVRSKEVPDDEVLVETLHGKFAQAITAGRHTMVGDEPVDVGGDDAGPSPYALLLAALGTCTSMTLQLYARRKQWPLEHVSVQLRHERIHAQDCAECPETDGKVERITREVSVKGELDEEQRRRLLEIADRCPVHRTLHGNPTVVSKLVP